MRIENNKEIHNLSNCELKNKLKDFDDLPMNGLNRSYDIDENLVYGEGLPLEENIHRSWLFTLNNK